MNILPSSNPFRLPIAEHPVFVAEARHLRPAPAQHYRVWSLLWAGLPALAIVSVWLVTWRETRISSTGIEWLLAGVFFFGTAFDIASLLGALNTAQRDFTAVKMDLLRLTPLHEKGIIAAKHALSLVRTRRTTLLMVGLRAGLLFVIGVSTIGDALPVGQWFSVALQLGFVAIIFLVLVIEPFWRNEMLTALGIYVATFDRSPVSVLLTAGFSLGIVWLMGLAVVGVSSIGLGLMASLLLSNVGYSSLDGSLLFGLWFNLFFLVLLASAIYGFNHLIERWCLRAALRRLKQAE